MISVNSTVKMNFPKIQQMTRAQVFGEQPGKSQYHIQHTLCKTALFSPGISFPEDGESECKRRMV